MSSLFGHGRRPSQHLVKLPAFCIPAAGEAENLRCKREAQLQWMRDKGVEYLIDTPVSRSLEVAPKRPAARNNAAVRLRKAS